jgi:Fe-S oxidoreductase
MKIVPSQLSPVNEPSVQIGSFRPADVVAPSGSCAGMVREIHPKLIAELGRSASKVPTYELSEFLVAAPTGSGNHGRTPNCR